MDVLGKAAAVKGGQKNEVSYESGYNNDDN